MFWGTVDQIGKEKSRDPAGKVSGSLCILFGYS